MLFLCTAILCCAFIAPKNKTALAHTKSQGGSLGILYDYENKQLSKDTLDALAVAASNDYAKIEDLIADVVENGTVINASKFGNNTLFLGKYGGTGDYLEWIPAYIAQTEIYGVKQVVLTLWLSHTKNSGKYEVSYFNDSFNSGNKCIPSSNLYSASYIHQLINNGNTYSNGTYFTGYGNSEFTFNLKSNTYEPEEDNKFVEFTGDGEISKFIIAPKFVDWQMSENKYKNDPSNTDEFYTSQSGDGYSYNGWTEDNIWLPSVTEVDASGYWKTTVSQRANSVTTRTRSADPDRFSYAMSYESGGYAANIDVINNGNSAVRPAIHIKLSTLSISVPKVAETNYNGEDWKSNEKFADLNVSWYNADFVKLNFPSSEMIDVNSYTLTANLTQAAFDNGLFWSDQTVDPKTFTFTVNKKPLAVKFESDENGYLIASFADEKEIYSRDTGQKYPKLITKYFKEGDETNVFAKPTSYGKWYAVAEIENDCNYTIDEDTKQSDLFEVTKATVFCPTLSGGDTTVTETYNGTKKTFTLKNITSYVKYSFDGLTEESYDSATGELVVSATDEGVYAVIVTLADGGEHTVWDSGDTDAKTVTINIVKSSDPDNPGGGTTDPTDPDNPGGGTTDPTDPDNPGGGTTDPTDPDNPGGGTTDPTDPDNPGGGTTDPTDPDNPGGGTTDPTDPDNPGGGTTDPTDPDNPGGSTTDPTDPDNPGGGTTDPTDPDNPGGGTTDPDNDTLNNNGVTAVWNKVKNFMSDTVLGLPVWAWFLIGLAVLVLLIIIIAVACKRRKSKEQRAEEKARREEERRLQQERIAAERELAKAKQEAELEKIRAQANMANAGLAGMAMQQSVQQQSHQSVTASAQITGDVARALAKIEAELEQLRANQSVQQSGYPPAAGGMDYHSVYAEERARAAETKLLEERVRIEERARAAEQRAMLAEERYWRGGNAIPAEIVVSLLQALSNGGNAAPVNITAVPSPATAAIPQSVERNAGSPPAQYPSDAVITTTTTVDTTKTKPVTRSYETETNFDIDGFYDKI